MIFIPRHLIEVRTSRSGGPGGQHVNKTETKVELRFVLAEATWISQPVRARLAQQNANRLNRDGEFLVSSERSRSQGQNLEDCFEKLAEMLAQAEREPKARRKTKPTRSSKERRLTAKKHRSQNKKGRGGNWE